MDSQGGAVQTIITEDVEIVGTIKAANAFRIDGKLNGDLSCSSDVIVGKNANIKGNLSVNCASIQGQVMGNIVAKDRIELKAAARINGDVKAKRLAVEDGVSFVGKAEVNPSGVSGARATPEPAVEHSAEAESDSDKGSEKGRSGLLGRR